MVLIQFVMIRFIQLLIVAAVVLLHFIVYILFSVVSSTHLVIE